MCLAAVSFADSASGRITSKSGYVYDAAVRMTSQGADTLTWHPFDLPKTLAAGTKSAEFSYGVGRDRDKQVQKTGSTVEATIYYVGTLFEKEVAAATTYRHYVSARGRTVAQVSRAGTTNTVQYLHRDHQGSVVEVTGGTGALVQSLAFDAWGLRRNASTWAALASPFGGAEPTERGYTGHEHLDAVELVHMNGRVQDPRLGRFLSPDPLVQAPYQSQSANRYSYVWNNPVSLVDPSGFQTEEFWVTGQRQYQGQLPSHLATGLLFPFPFPNTGPIAEALAAAAAAQQAPPPPDMVVTAKCGRSNEGACADPESSTRSWSGFWQGFNSGRYTEGYGYSAEYWGQFLRANLDSTTLLAEVVLTAATAYEYQAVKLAISTAIRQLTAARGAASVTDDAARALTASEPNRIYSARELVRRAAEPGPYHNFPESFNASIFRGNRQVISENYVLYTQRGSINGASGTFEIGVRPSVSGRNEVILHRFFRPD